MGKGWLQTANTRIWQWPTLTFYLSSTFPKWELGKSVVVKCARYSMDFTLVRCHENNFLIAKKVWFPHFTWKEYITLWSMATPPLKSFQRPWSMKNTLLTLKLVISGACMSDQWKSFLFLVCCSQVKYYWSFFSTDPIKEAPATIHDAWKFCKDHSRSVEVFYKNTEGDKILTRVHFQFDPEVSTVCVFAYLYVLYIYNIYICMYVATQVG